MTTISLHEYYEQVCQAFESWITGHYDKDQWVSHYTEDIRYHFDYNGGILDNDFIGWRFDWREAAIAHELDNMCGVRCPNCEYSIVYEYGDSPYCECDGEDYEDMSDDEVAEYMEDMDVMISDWSLEKAIGEGFDSYVEALEDSFGDVCETIKEGLERLTEYTDVYDLMATLLYVTTVYHASGHLLEDHAYDIDTDLIDEVRDNGLNSVWDREEIEEFMQEMER